MIREFSAGGVVIREGKVLVRMPKANPEYRGKIGWCLPKGWIDPGETVEQAALREVAEEVGVEAEIVRKIETIKYVYKNQEGEMVMKFVTFFEMRWKGNLIGGWGEETEKAEWMEVGEAKDKLCYRGEREVLSKI